MRRVSFSKQSWLAAWPRDLTEPRDNWMASLYFLSCSTLAGMTFQLLACLARVQLLVACKPRATHEIQSRVLAFLHNLEHFFTLSHTLPLHDSHLNTGILIAKIQANLARNKANKMVYKIQSYNFHLSLHVLFLFSLYTHVSYVCNLLFLFHTKMPWWVLFKVFQKYRLSKSIMPWTLFLQNFQEFMLGLDFIVFNKWVWVE